jgi:hypothetical protein
MNKKECRVKKQYDTKYDASREIYRLMVESAGGISNLRYYKCRFCKKFHLTSSQK